MTQIPFVYQLTPNGTAPKFNTAFAKGCGGAKIITDGKIRPGPIALWGEHKFYKTLHAAIAEGRTWYYGDHAYFGRGVYFRVTKNALQVPGHFNDHGPQFDLNMYRFHEVSANLAANKVHNEIEIHGQKNQHNGFILVCPPSEPMSERSGFTQTEWTNRVVAKLKRFTKRDIVIRQKPKVNRTPAPLLEALKGSFAAVTFTSNVATEAMLGGYPCFCTGDHPSNVFGNHDLARIEKPFLPDPPTLKAWAAMLCANQWTLKEIEAGLCWKAIQ